VLVKIDQCGGMTSRYQPGGPVVVCYEYIAKIESLAPAEKTADGVSRANAIAGAFVQAVLHEVAHALFDVLKAPVLGREDDAADKLAAFIMLRSRNPALLQLSLHGVGRGSRDVHADPARHAAQDRSRGLVRQGVQRSQVCLQQNAHAARGPGSAEDDPSPWSG
jgi:hypothetical protein